MPCMLSGSICMIRLTAMNKYISIIIGICAFLLIVAMGYFGYSRNQTWKSYVETDFGFRISYPNGWDMRDDLKNGKCCLFIAYPYKLSESSTTTEAGEIVTSVTVQDIVKIQIGDYYKPTYNPYNEASTTEVVLGKNIWHVGTTTGMSFYLLPKDDNSGIGAAIFVSSDVDRSITDEVMIEALQILASIKYAK